MIRIENISKSYDGVAALREVSFDVGKGEILGLVGPNGSGKTTLLKTLVGVVRPDSGRAWIAGVDSTEDALEARLHVGYSPGDPALYDSLSVLEILEFAIGFHPQASLSLGKQFLDLFGVPLEKRAGKLSHGMKRKLLLSQALASQAPVLILDEPMEGLDPEVRKTAEKILVEQAGQGRAILMSSHDLAGLERTCHRVAFLREGRLLDVGKLEHFLARASRVLHIRFRESVESARLPVGKEWTWKGDGLSWSLHTTGNLEAALACLKGLPIASCRDASGGLEEVFDALYGEEKTL
jgi:ABC-2 type transport system ATP-binding protein